MGNGTIQSSLFAATDEADIPDSVASQLADIFAGDIDFHRALRKGDRFAVVYESLEADGEVLRTGRVISAEFVNNGKTHQAFWFKEANAKEGGYFNADGISLRRAYLASPLAFSRMTSGSKCAFIPSCKLGAPIWAWTMQRPLARRCAVWAKALWMWQVRKAALAMW
jgi:hypothetical protein